MIAITQLAKRDMMLKLKIFKENWESMNLQDTDSWLNYRTTMLNGPANSVFSLLILMKRVPRPRKIFNRSQSSLIHFWPSVKSKPHFYSKDNNCLNTTTNKLKRKSSLIIWMSKFKILTKWLLKPNNRSRRFKIKLRKLT